MVSRYAVIEAGVVTNVVMWDGDPASWVPPEGAQVVPFDPTKHVISVPVDVQNADTLRDRTAQALAANATYLALNSPTAAQSREQVARLTRQVNAVIRLLVTDDTSDISDS